MRRVLATLASVALLTGCGAVLSPFSGDSEPTPTPTPAPSPTPTNFTIVGTLEISVDGFDATEGGPCVQDKFPDITGGSPITVTGADGTVVALGALGAGRAGETVIEDVAVTCAFAMSVGEVPEGDRFYGIEVARRGVVRFARADLESSVDDPRQLTPERHPGGGRGALARSAGDETWGIIAPDTNPDSKPASRAPTSLGACPQRDMSGTGHRWFQLSPRHYGHT